MFFKFFILFFCKSTKESIMNKDIIKGNWKEVKGKLKQQWGKLTDDEITQMHGSYEELQGTLQKKYGYQKEEAERQIETFVDKNHWE
jgi:uncharacterized protein YjbJ (UPF0337 family)